MRFVNPYDGVVFNITPRVMSISHEHIFNKNQFTFAYNQGVRIFACVNYFPSSPSVSTKNLNSDNEMSNFSNWKVPVIDWKNTNIPDDILTKSEEECLEYSTIRYYQGGVPYITVDGQNISTKLIPQIANAEHVGWRPNNKYKSLHHNILGNLFGEPTNGFSDSLTTDEVFNLTGDDRFDWFNQFENINQERNWRHTHMMFSVDELCQKYNSSEYQQFNGKLFGTVNHSYAEEVESYFKYHPEVFKAMELYNSYMTPEYNQKMRDKYDELLRKGYRIFGTAVNDWIGRSEVYGGGMTPEEKARWDAEYNALPTEQQAQYTGAADYYDKTIVKECNTSRGFNTLYVDGYDESNIETISDAMKVAEDGLDAYIAGKYYMTGTGTNYITSLVAENGTVSISVSGNPSSIKAITSKRVIESSGNSMSVDIVKGETYIRFEVRYYNNAPEGWNDMTGEEQQPYLKQGVMDFLFTNPVWIEDNDEPINDNVSMAQRAYLLLL